MPNLSIPSKPKPNLKINPDLIEAGNIDLKKRPKVKNPDGSYSTVYSFTFPRNGPEGDVKGPAINVPGVIKNAAGQYIRVPEGRKGEQMAWEYYLKTKQHLGVYKNIEAADKAAVQLHKEQAKMYGL